jgi:hypothetical protein
VPIEPPYDAADLRWQLVGYPVGEGPPTIFSITAEQLDQLRDMLDQGPEWDVDWYPVEADMWPRLREVLGCPRPNRRLVWFLETAAAEA